MDEVKLLKGCLGLCIALFIIIIGIIIYDDNKVVDDKKTYESKEELEQIVNPLTEVNSVEEMKKYLGFDVPVIKDKKVKSYIVIGEDKKAEHARIIYSDGSSFEMEKEVGKDVSGIYGGKFNKKETINDAEVSIYTMEDIKYGIWSDDTYSYSYSITKGKVSKLISDIKLIKKG